MKKIFVSIGLVVTTFIAGIAQKKADTVIIKIGEFSKVIFAIQDKKDLETLKYYNFQALMQDMITKLDQRDSTRIEKPSSDYLTDSVKENMASQNETISTNESNEEWPTEADRKRYRGSDWSGTSNRKEYKNRREYDEYKEYGKYNRRRTYSSFNVDLGTNNYLQNGKFPDESNSIYTVRPWGSWYVALNSIQRTRLANKFFLEWGGGVSWYNFKFQDNRALLTKNDTEATFSLETRANDFEKSKLTVVYGNFSLVPVIDFGAHYRKPGLFSGGRSRGFRFGVGPYVGYRIDSYTKQVFVLDGDSKVERHHDPYYLNNIRYGGRLQFGFRGTDFFFNYDINELFIANKGPQLNAFSFGVTF